MAQADENAQTGLHHQQPQLNPEQRQAFDDHQLHSALHRGITHLRQTYGKDLTMLADGVIAEKLVVMVRNERQQRGV